MVYYTKRLLTYYLKELNETKAEKSRATFQEDNHPIYGTVTIGLVSRADEANMRASDFLQRSTVATLLFLFYRSLS